LKTFRYSPNPDSVGVAVGDDHVYESPVEKKVDGKQFLNPRKQAVIIRYANKI